MTRQEQDQIVCLAQKSDIDCISYSAYSGKNMFGRTTYAIAIDTIEDVDSLTVYYNRSIMPVDDDLTFEQRLNFVKNGHGKMFNIDTFNEGYIIY